MDTSERDAMQPMTMRHLANTQLALRELKHVQLLCDSYSKAQHNMFAAANPEDMPPVSGPSSAFMQPLKATHLYVQSTFFAQAGFQAGCASHVT